MIQSGDWVKLDFIQHDVSITQYSNKGPLFVITDRMTGKEVARAWFDVVTGYWSISKGKIEDLTN